MRKIFFLVANLFCFFSMHAQISEFGKKILDKIEKNPVENLLKETPSITTSFADVDTIGMLPASFGKDSVYKLLTDLKRTEAGDYILEPGFYQLQVRSYCLRAGTHGPSSGYGYMYAPVAGPKAEIVMAIGRNSVFHPEIAQRDIQILLWAIIAKTKFDDLQPNTKLVATKLLTPQQILELQGGVIGVIPDAVLQKGILALPLETQKLMEAENDLRRKLTTANTTYEEMERVAVLAGMAPDNGVMQIESGAWSFHPDGYYVRYIPSSYSSTLLQICVPPVEVFLVNEVRTVIAWGSGDPQPTEPVTLMRSDKRPRPKHVPPKRVEWTNDGKGWKRWEGSGGIMIGRGEIYRHVATPANTGNQRIFVTGACDLEVCMITAHGVK